MTPTEKSAIAERARMDAEQRRLEAIERAKTPTELQETAARDFALFLGEDVDPLAVSGGGYEGRYYPCSYTVSGVTLTASYLWGGRDQRYHMAGLWKASRRIPRRLFGDRMETREAWSLGDLDGWFA